MNAPTTTAVIFLVFCLAILHPAQSYRCKKNDPTAALNWTGSLENVTIRCAEKFKSFWCCATGYSRITWSRKVSGASQWETFPWNGVEGSLDSGDQGAQRLFLKKMRKEDGGKYKCEVVSDKQRIEHIHTVDMMDCTEPYKKPVIVQPTDSNVTYYENLGSNFTARCLVSFGPKRRNASFPDLLFVNWYKANSSNPKSCAQKLIRDSNQPDFESKDPNNTKELQLIVKDLIITNITDADFGKYCCRGFNGGEHTDRTIQLQLGKVPDLKKPDRKLQTAMIAVVPIILVPILVFVVLWVFRLDILLFFHAKSGRRSANGSFSNLFEYDVILIDSGSNRDKMFVEKILDTELRKMQQEVFLPRRDLDLGYIDGEYIAAMRNSTKIILLLTEDFLREPLCGHIHDYIINDKRNDDIIFIQRGHIASELWETDAAIKNVDVLRTTVKNAKRNWLSLGRYLNWRKDFEIQSPLHDTIPTINSKRAHQIASFWKQLQLYLPSKEGAVEMRFVTDDPSPPPDIS